MKLGGREKWLNFKPKLHTCEAYNFLVLRFKEFLRVHNVVSINGEREREGNQPKKIFGYELRKLFKVREGDISFNTCTCNNDYFLGGN